MKTISLLFFIFLFINDVFGDEDKRVSLNDGGSVTLHTHTDLKRDKMITWWFNGTCIAKINGEANGNPVYDTDERFRDKLKMNPQTGDLTITHITSERAGDYQLDINGVTNTKSFSVGETERVSVNDGGSVTLHTHTDLKREDVIMWRFNGTRIAKINRGVNDPPVYDSDDERFTDRLKMNPQTGDLTITNITSEHTGEYQLENNNVGTKIKTFIVSLSPKVKKVIKGDSVSLHIDVTDEQRKDQIHWRIKHKNSLVAEIITENGRVTKNEAYHEFRGILELDEETGDVIITNMKKEDSGDYEAEVKIGSNTHTVHKTFTFTALKGDGSSTGRSPGVKAGIIFGVLMGIAVVAVVGVIFIKKRPQDAKKGKKPLNNGASNGDVLLV